MMIGRFCKNMALFVGLAVSMGCLAEVYPLDKNTGHASLGPTRVLPSGVEIATQRVGYGAKPKKASVVKVHYRGMLDSGVEFDNSYKRGAPVLLRLNDAIACWTQGVSTMAVGGKSVLRCPASTAYGKRGSGLDIPPDARLTFEVELLDILK